MDEIVKTEKLGDLYAYYGTLLTPGQQSYFEDYYYNDLSLGEIADNRGVSRQAVYDNLRRSSKLLLNYEKKLGMQAELEEIESSLVEISTNLDSDQLELAKLKLKKLINKMRGE